MRVVLGEQAARAHDLPGRAVAALHPVVLDERGLHRMQLVTVREPLDRGDRTPWAITASVRHALTRRPPTSTVHAPHCPASQPFFVPVSPSLLAQRVEQRVTRGSIRSR